MSKIYVIVQARMGSKRLPGKVTMNMCGQPMILWMLERLSRVSANKIIVSMPDTLRCQQELEPLVRRHGYDSFVHKGDPDDVLSRYAATVACIPGIDMDDTIVRVTGDCPLIDPMLIDDCIFYYENSPVMYVTLGKEWPDGLDVEVFPVYALIEANSTAEKPYQREHVTPYIWQNPKTEKYEVPCPFDLSKHKWSVDTIEDFSTVETIMHYNLLQYGLYYEWFHTYCTLLKHPSLHDRVTSQERNAAFVKQLADEEGVIGDWDSIRYSDVSNLPE